MPPTFCNFKRTIVNDINSRVDSLQIVANPSVSCSNSTDTRTMNSWDNMYNNVSRGFQRNDTTQQHDDANDLNVAITVDRTLEIRRKRFSENCEQSKVVSNYSKVARNKYASKENKITEVSGSTSSLNFVHKINSDKPLLPDSARNSLQKNADGTWFNIANDADYGTSESIKNSSDLLIVVDDSLSESCNAEASTSQEQSIIELSDASDISLSETDKEQSINDDVICVADSFMDDTELTPVNINKCIEKQQSDSSVILIEDDQKVTGPKKKET